MQRIITRSRLVPDPSMSDAEYIHQRRKEGDRAQATGTKPNLDIGKVWASENIITRLGALAHIRRRQHHHERAAERFKSLYEARYGCGNPGIDPSRIMVDSSPIAHDSGMAAKIDRTRELDDALTALGKPAFDRLVTLLVLCIPAGEDLHWRRRMVTIDVVLDDLDALAVAWQLKSGVRS